MGKLEKDVQIRTRNSKINRAILTILCVGVAGMLNPTMLVRGVLKELKIPEEKRRRAESSIYAARGRLIRRGLIKFDSGYWRITDIGKKILGDITKNPDSIKIPKRWDKKWRILIFDIREEKRNLRDKVRKTLTAVGFKRLQDSVWVYPYDCEDFVALLKADFKIGKDLLYIIADTVECDDWLRKEFSLQD